MLKRNKQLCLLSPLQSLMLLLDWRKLKTHTWNDFLSWSNVWNGCPNCKKNEFQGQEQSYPSYIEKNKRFVFRDCASKRWFWRTTSLIKTNHAYILVKITRGMLFFVIFGQLGFRCGKWWALADDLFHGDFVKIKMLLIDNLIEVTKTKNLEESKMFGEKNSFMYSKQTSVS